MPSSGNGIGTVHYGRSAEAEDGSYVATVWFVIFYLPIFPLRSERILLLSEFDNGFGTRRIRYSILERVPLDWRGIRKTYLVGWGILAWYVSLLVLYFYFPAMFHTEYGVWLVLAWLFLPFGIWAGWQKWLRPAPKLKSVEIRPGSEFSVYRKTHSPDTKRD